MPPNHLGALTRLDAVCAALAPVAGLRLLDVGCGASRLLRDLAAMGAACTGVDPFMPPRVWQDEGAGRWRILQTGGESLPLADASFEAVLFVYSLHHVPAAVLPNALAEARRVLAPGGRLYVAEPHPDGDFDSLISTFHDESAVLAGAQAALDAARPMFATHLATTYVDRRVYPSFEAFATTMTANTRFNDYAADDVVAPPVRARFAELFARNGGVFDQPVKVDVFA